MSSTNVSSPSFFSQQPPCNELKYFIRYSPIKMTLNSTIFSFFLLLIYACSGGSVPWQAQAQAATYYVKAGGNDSLDGLSDATAWASIAKVTAMAKSGDIVCFRSQDSWSSSTLPVLAATAGVTYDGSTYGSGTRAKLKATGRYTGGSIDGVVNIYVSNVVFKGFEVDGNQQITGGIYIGFHAAIDTSNIMIDNCVVHDNGGPEQTPTNFYYGILIGQVTYHKLSNVAITNTEVYNTGHEGISIYPSRGTTGDNHVDTVLIRNCTIHDTAHWGGITWGNAIDAVNHSDNITIEYNTIYKAGNNGFSATTYSDIPSPGSPNNVIVRYNLIYNCLYGITFNPGNGNGTFGNTQIYGNILIDNGINFSGGKYNSKSQKIYNNTIYIPTALKYGIYMNDGGIDTSGIDIKNNIIYTTAFPCIKDWDGVIVTHSNNLIYQSNGSSVTHIIGKSGATYNRASVLTWEPTSKNTLPGFTGGNLPTGFSGNYGINMVPNTNYFSITSGDAIDNGATLGSPYNGCINGAGLTTPIFRPQGAGYDIGAYEYVVTVTTPLPPPSELRLK